MDTSNHSFETLFLQLGLANSDEAINAFIKSHQLPKDTPLEQASFWTEGQLQFIHEALELDSDWCEIVDQLDAQLRY
jgi:hypothetical protein